MRHLPLITRRGALLGLAGAFTLGGASLALASAATDRRFVVIILRGALDGMAAVVPYGDANLASLRGELLPPGPGEANGLRDLGGFYGLHPALAGLHDMYAANEMLVVHAVAGSYRSRSHFEAQDYMEYGADHRMTSGWLNRVAAALPAPTPATAKSELALAVGTGVPLLLRGKTPVASWLPQAMQQPGAELYARIAQLNHADGLTGPAIAEGLRDRGFSSAVLAGSEQPPNRNAFPALAGAAGKLLAAADGPRLAALEIGGWDTHSAQSARLAGPLGELDAGLVALKSGLGAAWAQTAVLVITEFGRTVRVNGTRGTDHGTGTVAFLAGGSRTATCNPPPTCAPSPRACWPGISASAPPRWARSSRTARRRCR